MNIKILRYFYFGNNLNDIIIDNIVEIPSDIYESMEVNYDLMRKRMERISPVKMGEKFLKALHQIAQ